MMADLMVLERQEPLARRMESMSFDDLERVIEQHLASFYIVGLGLMTIKNSRQAEMKARGYISFEEYCETRWEHSRRRAYQLINGAHVVENLTCEQLFTRQDTWQLPVNEAQARELSVLPIELQEPAWKLSRDLAGEQPLTANIVRRAVRQIITGVVDIPAEVDQTEFEDEFEPEYLNLWTVGQSDPRFGTAGHPGRMPGQIVANLLWLYTVPDDLVLDPFAGGGTTIDVAKAMGRRCAAFDLRPRREDIKEREASQLRLADLPSPASFVFLDPPYWSQKHGEYTDDPADYSNLRRVSDFYDSIEHLARILASLLDGDGAHVALAVSQSRVSGVVYDLAFECAKRFEYAGYRLVERIVTNYGQTASTSGDWIAKARLERFLLRGYRDILMFTR